MATNEPQSQPLLSQQDVTRLTERFWRKVHIIDDGYGALTFQNKHYRAHRLAWMLTHGAIPESMVVMHTCDNPACVNPNHLRLGTQRDNMADMHRKGRAGNPVNRKYRPITTALANEIRDALYAGQTQQSIAGRFRVSQDTISRIKRGVWKEW